MSNKQPYSLLTVGMLNALGNNPRDIIDNLLRGYAPGLLEDEQIVPGQTLTLGIVTAELPELPEALKIYNCRNNRLALAALQQIRETVDEQIKHYGAHRIALVVGTSTSGIAEGENAIQAQLNGQPAPVQFHYKQQEIGTLAPFLATYLGINGPAYTLSTACSSSAKAFASAQRLLDLDLCDSVIVGGVDSLCQLTVNGFKALDSVSSSPCNPFSINRKGINIGEAAALFVLSRDDYPIKLMGVGESSDAYHISAPEPEGKGANQAISMALDKAGLEADQIHYINLHGTATQHNDAMESKVAHHLFPHAPLCSSTKALTGHTLGAAGATETGICWLLLSDLNSKRLAAPQIWDQQADPELPALNLAKPGDTLPEGKQLNCLSNSFAFGGSNAAVIISREYTRD
jgi:3-oxoacyl-[acyl-carrier-protein] synthase-1